jgi:hypothetical protein
MEEAPQERDEDTARDLPNEDLFLTQVAFLHCQGITFSCRDNETGTGISSPMATNDTRATAGSQTE